MRFSWLLLFFYVNIFLHTKVENSVSKQGSESKVEGMVSLLLLGKTGHFSATKVSEEHLITQGITKSDEWLTVEKSWKRTWERLCSREHACPGSCGGQRRADRNESEPRNHKVGSIKLYIWACSKISVVGILLERCRRWCPVGSPPVIKSWSN